MNWNRFARFCAAASLLFLGVCMIIAGHRT